MNFVSPASLGDSFSKILAVLGVLEENRRYMNQSPKGEPQLGKRGLYRNIGGHVDAEARETGDVVGVESVGWRAQLAGYCGTVGNAFAQIAASGSRS